MAQESGRHNARLRSLEEIKGSWIETFLADKRAGGRRGVIPKESSIAEYAFHLNALLKDGVDLKSASLEEIKQWLADYQAADHKPATYANKVVIFKDALRYLGREDCVKAIRTPRLPDRAESVKDKILSDEDVSRLIHGAPTLRDRLLVELFFELGARLGEIANLKIKDVQFDKYGAIIMLTGKTGSGPRRVYDSVTDLRSYLNEHPAKDDPNSSLFMTLEAGRPLDYTSIYFRIKHLGLKILKRPIHPHQFRHTRATKDARYFTDREMMKLNRWKRPDMVGVYAHLSMRDVEDKDLVLHGLKRKEDILRPITETRKCKSCQEENAPIAIFCVKCGAVLSQTTTEENEELKSRLAKLEGQFETILKTKITKET